MKLLSFFTIILILTSCAPSIKQLQENEIKEDTISNFFLFDYINSLIKEDYYTKLDSVKIGQSNDFFTLRMAYTKTDNYSPYGSDIGDSLKNARISIESNNFNKALMTLSYIHNKNYVDIPSHLYCGYIYDELGDSIKSEFHYNIYKGLLNSIYESGDGHTPKTAFIVIDTKEEYEFLDWFGLQSNSQSLIISDGYNFDLLKVIDPKTEEELEIYFNIDLALEYLQKILGD